MAPLDDLPRSSVLIIFARLVASTSVKRGRADGEHRIFHHQTRTIARPCLLVLDFKSGTIHLCRPGEKAGHENVAYPCHLTERVRVRGTNESIANMSRHQPTETGTVERQRGVWPRVVTDAELATITYRWLVIH